ncbi:MAG TPA: glycosyltransferase family 1 protein [Polyangiaceae bacterium]|nr:glycosyltransferase family 1 protein [Polyangiaceae bacterium]
MPDPLNLLGLQPKLRKNEMPSDGERPSYELCLVCYPFFPTKDSGRGVDRYLYELIENLRGLRTNLRVLEQGSSVGAWAAGQKLCRLVADLLSVRSGVYHAVTTMAGATAILLGRGPVVVTIHDLLPFQVTSYNPSLKSAFARKCTQISVARAAALIVPFRVTKDELVASHGALASKIHVVNYGVDHATYYPRPAVQRSTRRVLYVGEVSCAKGVDVLINAFARVRKAIPDAELVIGGKGRDRAQLESLSESLGLSAQFLGFVPEADLPELYASAAVMVFPSRYGFGLSSLEAMACGTPVIVARTLDAPEFVSDAGLLVTPGDAEELASSIGRILAEPSLREELTTKGIARAAQYSWSATAEKTRAVCDAVFAER